jgi:ferrous iron transport protein B
MSALSEPLVQARGPLADPALRTLADLPIGERAVVGTVGGSRRVALRLLEMGLVPGTPVQMVRKAPLGDPFKIRVRGYLLSLRRADALRIQIQDYARPSAIVLGAGAYRFPVRSAHKVPSARLPRILVAGNANSGKTTVFNALSGARAQVSNYPGVTVSRSTRRIDLPDGSRAELSDLPGTYSLSAHSPEEAVAVDAVLGRRGEPPDVVLVVVDAGALERGLYLVLQILETGVPAVVALNMMDEAASSGADFDTERLSAWLGVSVVPTVASRGVGLDALLQAVADSVGLTWRTDSVWHGLPAEAERDVREVEAAIGASQLSTCAAARRSWALWGLLSLGPDDEIEGYLPSSVITAIDRVRAAATSAGRDLDLEIVAARYRWIEHVIADVRDVSREDTRKWTDRLDGILTQRVYGLVVFAVVMGGLFEALFTWSEPLIEGIEATTGFLQTIVAAIMPAGMLRELLVDGVIAGVGNVIVFVPQIAMLFLFIALLEDVGYLARVAFVIDRVMGRVGLHGKAFVPMLSGFACAVPAVLATRTIESRRDRLITMLTLPLISCSARLPVYALVTAVIFAANERLFGIFSVGAAVLFAMYALSVLATLGAAFVLRRTVLRGPRLPLVLELPPYRIPVWRNVLSITQFRVQKFLVDAGTIILAMTIVLWALLSFPRSGDIASRHEAARAQVATSGAPASIRESQLAEIDGREAAEQMQFSLAGRLGRAIEPVIAPLGFDWRLGIGILGAFAAREVFVSTMGIVFGIEDADEESGTLRASLQGARRSDGSKLMTPLTGVSLMIFFVLACQCMSTIVVVRRESGGWGWPAFMFGYMSVMAYIASLIVYQVGSALGWGVA